MVTRRRETASRRGGWRVQSWQAVARCPAPWEPIDADLDAQLLEIVQHHPDKLRYRGLNRPAWEVLIRYGLATKAEKRRYVTDVRRDCEGVLFDIDNRFGRGSFRAPYTRDTRRAVSTMAPMKWIRNVYQEALDGVNAWAEEEGLS